MLQSLDLDAPTPRHFRQARSAAEQDDADDATKQWLNIASGLDDAARVLIRYCLATAAQEAVDKSREWIALAEAIAEEEDIDLRAVRAIVEDAEVLNSESPDDAARAKDRRPARETGSVYRLFFHAVLMFTGTVGAGRFLVAGRMQIGVAEPLGPHLNCKADGKV